MKPKNYFAILVSFLSLFFYETSHAQMYWSQACTFSGTNSSYVAVRDAAELDITGSFTIEAWVNPVNVTSPQFQIILQKRDAGSDGYTLYLSNGKVAIRTGSGTRLTGSTVIPINTWSHIAGTFNLATNTFATYVNGVFDSSVVDPGSAPPTNSDSIWIGKGFNDPFRGRMDEVRIWNRAKNASEISNQRRTSLGSGTGPYSGLVMSMTFQDNDGSGAAFTLTDWSGNGNTGINRGVTAFDMSNRPLQTIQINDCIELDGAQDYLTGPDNANVSPTSQLTLSAWIYLRSYANSIIIHKGTAAGGAGTNYRLSIVSRKLSGAINGNFSFTTDDTVALNRWTYVTFTYNALFGSYQFHMDGELVYQGVNELGNIVDGTDSLYIGGSSSLVNFDGYIDEVRIIPDVKFTETINNFMFRSIDLSNGGAGNYAIYNFDGYAYNNGTSTTPLLRFSGNSSFAYCGAVNNQPQSPLDRADNLNFQNAYYLKSSDRRIPASGNSGNIITDSLEILNDVTINDLNVFIALNHNQEQDLQIFLFPPNGGVAQLFNENSLVFDADHVITIFDDQADSTLNDGRYVNFSTRIKPNVNINGAVGGNSSKGIWRLVVRDVNNSGGSDTGRLYGWGVQINNAVTKPYLMDVTTLIQGFYRPSTNTMVQDTMRFYLRNTQFPYGIYDSAKKFLSNTGFTQINFSPVSSGVAYYLQLKHRNSIETWSYPLYYDPLTYEVKYDFTDAVTQAFGDNMIEVDDSPLTFAIYGGDVTQNGVVDAPDIVAIDNDAFNFVTGYVNTDVTGDNVTDANDLALTDNNAFNFVTKQVPPGALDNSEESKTPVDLINNSNGGQDPNIGGDVTEPNSRIRTSEEEIRK